MNFILMHNLLTIKTNKIHRFKNELSYCFIEIILSLFIKPALLLLLLYI